MKRFYTIVVLTLAILPIKAIKEIPVDFRCNIHTINKEEHDVGRTFTLACEDGGWCVVKKSNHPNQKVGYGGLYIFRSPFTNEWDEPQFYCLDLLCTVLFISTLYGMYNATSAVTFSMQLTANR